MANLQVVFLSTQTSQKDPSARHAPSLQSSSLTSFAVEFLLKSFKNFGNVLQNIGFVASIQKKHLVQATQHSLQHEWPAKVASRCETLRIYGVFAQSRQLKPRTKSGFQSGGTSLSVGHDCSWTPVHQILFLQICLALHRINFALLRIFALWLLQFLS